MQSAIYRGWVEHHRREPIDHRFRFRMFMLYLDLAELDRVFAGTKLWAAERPALASFRSADHYGEQGKDLDSSVRDLVARTIGRRPTGPIRLLTHLRYFGYVFNPVSFYYCYDANGEELDAIVAEVANTPWNERHMYVLNAANPAATDRTRHFTFLKAFHVSPFMPMKQWYDWTFSVPEDCLDVRMMNWQDGRSIFHARMRLERREISPAVLRMQLIAHPFMTMRVVAAIYWNALRLKMKGVPVHTHPGKVSQTA